jgi:hypothetical protein
MFWKVLLKLRASGRCRKPARRWTVRPCVEECEPRVVPAQFRWVYAGADAGNNVVANWQVFMNGNWVAATNLPGGNDEVDFNGAVSNKPIQLVNLTTWGKLEVVGGYSGAIKLIAGQGTTGSLQLNGITNVSGDMSSGEIDQLADGANITISGGTFNWSGGAFNPGASLGQNVKVDGATAVMNISANAATMKDTLNVIDGGTVNIQTLNQDLTINPGTNGTYAVLVGNNSTVNLTMSQGNIRGFSNNPISNGGTFNFNTTATVICELPFVNAGQFNIQQGTLDFTKASSTSGYSVVSSQGTVAISVGATLEADYGYSQTGGVLETVGQGQATLNGNVVVTGGLIKVAVGNGGNNTGQLTVLGSVTLTGTAMYFATINTNTGMNDNLYATGNITIGGQAQLNVTTVGLAPPAGTKFDILWGVGGITGDFNGGKSFVPVSYTTAIVNDIGGVGQHYELTA